MKNELNISVTIAERPYQLKINRDDEEIIRKAAKEINELINDYARRYAYKDKQDLLAMVVLNNTVRSIEAQKKISYKDTEMLIKLEEINSLLSEEISD